MVLQILDSFLGTTNHILCPTGHYPPFKNNFVVDLGPYLVAEGFYFMKNYCLFLSTRVLIVLTTAHLHGLLSYERELFPNN